MSVLIDCGNIDWKLLRIQKQVLLDMIQQHPSVDELDGVLHLIDYIQDEAAQQIGDEKVVFGEFTSYRERMRTAELRARMIKRSQSAKDMVDDLKDDDAVR